MSDYDDLMEALENPSEHDLQLASEVRKTPVTALMTMLTALQVFDQRSEGVHALVFESKEEGGIDVNVISIEEIIERQNQIASSMNKMKELWLRWSVVCGMDWRSRKGLWKRFPIRKIGISLSAVLTFGLTTCPIALRTDHRMPLLESGHT